MCINPRRLPSGVEVPCRKCWQCEENRISDWVGRCIAESETAVATSSITLTYGGGDHERAAVLTYSDVQKWLKLLRWHKYPLRYLAVGEYGSAKGRAHWHVLAFWLDQVPPHDTAERFMERHWPHGWSHWEEPSPASIRYVCKYITKDARRQQQQGYLSMSKRPPLGTDYFHRLAARYVAQGLAPQEGWFWFGHVLDQHQGTPVRFYMTPAVRDRFCQSFLDQWAERWGGHPPVSQLIEDYCDRAARFERPFQPVGWQPRSSYPWMTPPGGHPVRFSEPHNAYWTEDLDGQRLWWSWNKEGERAWLDVLATETSNLPWSVRNPGKERARDFWNRAPRGRPSTP